MVLFNISINKQKYPNETKKKKRERTKITGSILIQNFTPPEINKNTTIYQASSQFNMEMLKALDAITSIKDFKFPNWPKHLWFNKFITEQRTVVKSCKRSWRKCRQHHQWQAFMKGRSIYNRLLKYHEKQTISKMIIERNTKHKTTV